MNSMVHEEVVRQHIADLHAAAAADHVARVSRRRYRARVRHAWREAVGNRLVDMGLALMDECRATVTLQASK